MKLVLGSLGIAVIAFSVHRIGWSPFLEALALRAGRVVRCREEATATSKIPNAAVSPCIL
jgi:hypothetical protein